MSEKNSENKKVTQQQKVYIVDFMQENYSFLMGKFSSMDGRMKKNLKWHEFGEMLNKLGPPVKDIAKWKKTWADMKAETKKKFQSKRQNLNTSGAGPIDIAFSQLDEKIVQICGKQLLDGDSDVNEIGFDSKVDGDGDGDSNDVIMIESDETILPPLKSKPMKLAPQKTTPVKTPRKTATPKSRKRLFNENDDAMSGFPELDETSNTPTKRTYQSHNNQVELALSHQEKQTMLLERIIVQNDGILDELKQIKEQISKQNNSFFHY